MTQAFPIRVAIKPDFKANLYFVKDGKLFKWVRATKTRVMLTPKLFDPKPKHGYYCTKAIPSGIEIHEREMKSMHKNSRASRSANAAKRKAKMTKKKAAHKAKKTAKRQKTKAQKAKKKAALMKKRATVRKRMRAAKKKADRLHKIAKKHHRTYQKNKTEANYRKKQKHSTAAKRAIEKYLTHKNKLIQLGCKR
jgi:hypothetical protein